MTARGWTIEVRLRADGTLNDARVAALAVSATTPADANVASRTCAPPLGSRPQSCSRPSGSRRRRRRVAAALLLRRRPYSSSSSSSWLLKLGLLVLSRSFSSPATSSHGQCRADGTVRRYSNSYVRRSSTSTTTTSSSSGSPQDMVTDMLPNQAISGICMTSEPRPDCGILLWDDLSCHQVLHAYQFDPSSTCCSLHDTATPPPKSGPRGCTLTVGGAGNTCTWREPGTADQFFTVHIMDGSTSTCPPTAYRIPTHPVGSSSSTPSSIPSMTSSSSTPTIAPSPKLGSDAPSLLPSSQFVGAGVPVQQGNEDGGVPIQPVPPKGATTIRPSPPPYAAPAMIPLTSPAHADDGRHQDDDDATDIPEAPIPSPTAQTPTAGARPKAPTSHPIHYPDVLTSRKSGSCWATDPTPECGMLDVPSLTCTDLLQAYEWHGTCCSFRDTPDPMGGRGGCTVTVGGPHSHCTWRQKNEAGSGKGEEYTMYMSGTSTCPTTTYTVPVGPDDNGWDGPTPAPERATGSCWTTHPNEECGLYTWSNSCVDVAAAYEWEGSCCSVSDTDSGGCRLTVNGPGSTCTFRDDTSEYSIYIAQQGADGTCPKSSYELHAATPDGTTYDSPTPEPVRSGYCTTTYPDAECGVYEWNETCQFMLSHYEWSGTCCSLSGTSQGGCRLVVDGPGSTCTWKELANESYFSVEIDEQNDRTCPTTSASSSVLPGANPPSEFTQCATQAFGNCLTTCQPYPTLRQSFRACARSDPTQAVQCLAGAASVCVDADGKAPMFLCQQLASMVSSIALPSAQCLSLQEKCALQGNLCA